MSNPKTKSKDAKSKGATDAAAAREGVRGALTGDAVTVAGVTIPVPKALDDLPRSLIRRVRQAQVKYAMPAEHDRSGNRYDVYGLAYEVGEMIVRHYGAEIDPDDESIPFAEWEAQEAIITALGLRVVSKPRSEPEGESGPGGAPNAPEPPEQAEPEK